MSLIGPEGRKQLQLAARFATAGLELVISIVIGYFGGRALDRWLGSEPYCGYVGLVLGVAAGFYNLFKLARPAATPPDASADTDPEASDPDKPSREP
jgi:ATP synthase protein I